MPPELPSDEGALSCPTCGSLTWNFDRSESGEDIPRTRLQPGYRCRDDFHVWKPPALDEEGARGVRRWLIGRFGGSSYVVGPETESIEPTVPVIAEADIKAALTDEWLHDDTANVIDVEINGVLTVLAERLGIALSPATKDPSDA